MEGDYAGEMGVVWELGTAGQEVPYVLILAIMAETFFFFFFFNWDFLIKRTLNLLGVLLYTANNKQTNKNLFFSDSFIVRNDHVTNFGQYTKEIIEEMDSGSFFEKRADLVGLCPFYLSTF